MSLLHAYIFIRLDTASGNPSSDGEAREGVKGQDLLKRAVHGRYPLEEVPSAMLTSDHGAFSAGSADGASYLARQCSPSLWWNR